MLGPKNSQGILKAVQPSNERYNCIYLASVQKFLGRKYQEPRGGATICPLVRKILGHTLYDLT